MTGEHWLWLLLILAYLGVGAWCADQFVSVVRNELRDEPEVYDRTAAITTNARAALLLFTWLPELIWFALVALFHRGHGERG